MPLLSPQELSLLKALAEGCQSKEIAVAMARSKPTVEAMVRVLYLKFNARTRAHLVAKAIAGGIIEISHYPAASESTRRMEYTQLRARVSFLRPAISR